MKAPTRIQSRSYLRPVADGEGAGEDGSDMGGSKADDMPPKIGEGPAARQPSRDVRASGRDGPGAGGTSGAAGVTGGWRSALKAQDLWRGGMILLVFFIPNTIVNVLTAHADNPGFALWKPVLWETSSTLTLLAMAWIAWVAIALAPPDEAAAEGWRPKARFVLVHGAALLAFSALHVAGFVAIRKAVYRLMDAGPYVFGDRFAYELRKDLLAYALLAGVFWLTAYLRRRRNEPVRPVSFDIRDGARIVRVPLTGILAISSAGNYVEFHLADGRRPLMRTTLAAVDVELGGFGFVRTHRSWLVNAACVTVLRPDGSGDWTVELGAVEAPLSRRFPQALERLRTG